MFWFVYKINSENFGHNHKPLLQQHWHCHIVTICPSKFSQYYTSSDNHSVASKCHKVVKLYMPYRGKKIVTTCSQNLLYVSSVIKMWYFRSVLWLVNFLSQMKNKTAVLSFAFCEDLISVFAVRGLFLPETDIWSSFRVTHKSSFQTCFSQNSLFALRPFWQLAFGSQFSNHPVVLFETIFHDTSILRK